MLIFTGDLDLTVFFFNSTPSCYFKLWNVLLFCSKKDKKIFYEENMKSLIIFFFNI